MSKTETEKEQVYSVFRKGKWIRYRPNVVEDPFLTEEMKWTLTSAYATAISQGFSEEKATILAEMHMFKKKFSDLLYSAELEAEYRKLFF